MEFFNQFKQEFIIILTDGGILMVPLAILALTIYGLAFTLLLYFSDHPFYRMKRDKVMDYVFNPIIANPELREILEYTQDPEIQSKEEVSSRFAEVQNAYLSHIDGRRNFLFVLVTTAPLMGLLGTVMGMLTTFSGIAVSVGGKTVDQIAEGISEALITTQTGLIIAIPAYVMVSLIQKRRDEMESFLGTVEALTIQLFEKKLKTNLSA